MARLQLIADDGTQVVIDYALPEAMPPEAGPAHGSFDFTLPAGSGRSSSIPCRAFLDPSGLVGHRDVVSVMERASYREGEGGPPLVSLHRGDEEMARAQAQAICTRVADVIHGRGDPINHHRAQRVLTLAASVKAKLEHAEAMPNALARLGFLQEARALSLQLALKLAAWEPSAARGAEHLREAEHLALLGYEKENPALPRFVVERVVKHLLVEALNVR